jgi:hypothetical protein
MKKAKVRVLMGNIFEGGADLTALPCGAKGSVTGAIQSWVDRFSLPIPKQVVPVMKLGDVTQPVPFSGPVHITKYIAYAASVHNDGSNPEAIKQIGEHLGRITKSHSDIRTVEAVLFGTGHGRMADKPAGIALAAGFRRSADPSSTLWIWVFGHDRHAQLKRAVEGNALQRVWDSVDLKFTFFGSGMNFKKLFGLDK